MSSTETALFESSLTSLEFLHRGKVRDIYAVDADKLLIVQTDRLSAFDVILPTPVPGKGRVLTAMSNFWFDKLSHIMPNHLTGIAPESVVAATEREQVVAICGITLPAGLQEAAKLPGGAIFTPSTKAPMGAHDENIPFAEAEKLLGKELAAQVRDKAIALYTEAADFAASKGIIIADTKFEFGRDAAGRLYLIDEALTPDSSRFWPAEQYAPGKNPPSYDKQFVRDWLETQDWNKKAPAPTLPAEVLARTTEKYQEALRRLTD